MLHVDTCCNSGWPGLALAVDCRRPCLRAAGEHHRTTIFGWKMSGFLLKCIVALCIFSYLRWTTTGIGSQWKSHLLFFCVFSLESSLNNWDSKPCLLRSCFFLIAPGYRRTNYYVKYLGFFVAPFLVLREKLLQEENWNEFEIWCIVEICRNDLGHDLEMYWELGPSGGKGRKSRRSFVTIASWNDLFRLLTIVILWILCGFSDN